MRNFIVAVFCEESQTLVKALRKVGIEAYSFDLKDCSGGHPEWHIKGDCLPYINGNCTFTTMDGKTHKVGKWDMIVAHPTCTYLTNAGARHFNIERYGDKARQRWQDRYEAAEFFMRFINADCDHICVENPVGWMNTSYRKPDQTIQPWWFGDMTVKRTCYWLKGLPKLERSIWEEPFDYDYYYHWVDSKGRNRREPKWYRDARCSDMVKTSELRSKSFPMVAKAMAEQWALKLKEEN